MVQYSRIIKPKFNSNELLFLDLENWAWYQKIGLNTSKYLYRASYDR